MNYSRSRVHRLMAAIAVLATMSSVFSLPVYAQQGVIEEIIVTARQREETLQDVPVTVSAFSQEEMAKYNVQNLPDAARLIPAVNIYQAGSGNGSNLYIRGVGSSSISAAFDHSVAISIDGVVGNTGRLIHNAYLDMRQLEVMKGPQSLYFGKSATAGVVAITTNDPGDELEVIGSAGYGFEKEAVYSEFIVSSPITDTLGARLALGWQETDKLYENASRQATNTDLTEESLNSRLTLLWEPTDKLLARFKLNYSEYENDGPASYWSRRCVDGSSQNANGVFTGVFDNLDEDCSLNGTTNRADHPPITYIGVADGNGGVPYLEQDLLLTSLQFDYQLTDTLELTSITAWLDQETDDVGNYCYCTPDSFQVPGGFFGSWSNNVYEGFTQEFRLLSSFDGPVNFMAGFFYEDVHQEFNTDQYAVNATYVLGPSADNGSGRVKGSDWRKDHTTETDIISAFIAGYWNITDTVELSAGVRYTDVERDNKVEIKSVHEALLGGLVQLPPGTVLDENDGLEFDDDNWSPEVAVTWDATDEFTFYAAYKTGFKPGGIDNSVLPSATLNPDDATFPDFMIFDSEEAQGGEIGMKSTLLEGSMRLNATAFYYEYDDLQVQQFNSQAIQFRTTNAGELTVQGAEFDMYWATPVEGLTLHTAWAFTDNEYTDEFVQVDGTDLDGEKREGVPDITGNIGFTWDWTLTGDWTLSLSGDARYSDDYVTDYPDCDADCQPVTQVWHPGFSWEQSSFWLYDASLRLASERWEVLLSGINLNDKYINYEEGAIPGTVPDLSGAPGTTALEDNRRLTNLGRRVILRATVRL